MIRNYIMLGLIVVCTVLAFLGWHQRDERLRKEGENRLLQVRNDSLASLADESERARETLQVQAHMVELAALHLADSALVLIDAAKKQRPQVIDRIVNREAPADTAVARRVAQAVADSITEHEIKPRDEREAQHLVVIASLRTQLAASDDARVTAQNALAAFRATVPPRPGFIESHGGTALKMAGAFAAGYGFARR